MPTPNPGARSFAPAGTPAPVLDRLSHEIMAALTKPKVKDAIQKLGFTLNVRDPAAFGPYLAQELKTWGDIIKTAGVPMQG